MKIVIDIPQDIYDEVKEYGITTFPLLAEVIQNGTPVQTGLWIGIDEEPHEDYECDICGYVCSTWTANIKPNEEYKFCPNCGCRMIEPQESEDKCKKCEYYINPDYTRCHTCKAESEDKE